MRRHPIIWKKQEIIVVDHDARSLVSGPSHAAPRIPLIDTLRALALLGVIIMNVNGMVLRFAGDAVMARAGIPDLAWMGFDLVLVQGKARACFALLFGVGMAIQLRRARAGGTDFASGHIARMLVLLVIGIVNQTFLFWGDILVLYALLGLAVLPLRHLSDRAMVGAGLLLVTVPPLIAGVIEIMVGHPLPALVMVDAARETARGLAAMTSADYADFVRFSATQAIERRLTDTAHMLVYDSSVFGLFLIGGWIGRRDILADPIAHRRLLRQVVIICLPVGLVLSIVSAGRLAGIHASAPWEAAMTAAAAGLPIMALGYVALFARILSIGAGRLQAVLAPVGRMALTDYLLSGAIGCWFHYGYGLRRIGTLGLAETNCVALVLFALLAGFSHLWLSRFQQGPVEWLWRRGARALVQGPADRRQRRLPVT